MFIGTFCKATGTTPKTIRYYESIGLLPTPERLGSYRHYDDTYIETVRQIKLAQSHGFSLSEIRQWATGSDIRRGFPIDVIRKAIGHKKQSTLTAIEQLQGKLNALEALEASLANSTCNLDSVP